MSVENEKPAPVIQNIMQIWQETLNDAGEDLKNEQAIECCGMMLGYVLMNVFTRQGDAHGVLTDVIDDVHHFIADNWDIVQASKKQGARR